MASAPQRESAKVVYAITCSLCGQSWQQKTARAGAPAQCLFCGTFGQLRGGPASPESSGPQQVWLESSREPCS